MVLVFCLRFVFLKQAFEILGMKLLFNLLGRETAYAIIRVDMKCDRTRTGPVDRQDNTEKVVLFMLSS